MSVIHVSRCEVTRGTLSGRHVLTLICKTMTGSSFKIVLNWTVLTPSRQPARHSRRVCPCHPSISHVLLLSPGAVNPSSPGVREAPITVPVHICHLSSPRTQRVTRVHQTDGNAGPARFRFGPVPNWPKFKIQI